ncbi:MAG: hypothetical protein HQK76_07050 [Desulfobacterales bacterium]|nr:hypothetical protein [Desulfobacterales bacterium]
MIKCIINKEAVFRIFGIITIFAIIGWFCYCFSPIILNDGYINAGDDHIHVGYSNELKRICDEEGRLFGWSRLYAAGAPIFLLRPPGFYFITFFLSKLSNLTIEQSIKIVVLFGFCLYPLSVFIGTRLLGLGYFCSLFAAILSPLPISLWGHTVESYQYLGVYKQLIAILLFPILIGSFWRVLKFGTFGILYAFSFFVVFITHPYMAYCFALLTPLMIISLLNDKDWSLKKGIKDAFLWSLPAILWVGLWLIPFVTSQEIMTYKPYSAGRRANFEVTVLTSAETLRQYFLGGILDTTQFAGKFGGEHIWAWLDNSKYFRIPIISIFSFLGLIFTVFNKKSSVKAFIALTFMFSFFIFIGPDDFPFLDLIPFSYEFQNIHAVFLFDWVAFVIAAIGIVTLFKISLKIRIKYLRYIIICCISLFFIGAYGTSIYERTQVSNINADVRNIYTENGEMLLKANINEEWKHFYNVVKCLKSDSQDGSIASKPYEFENSVLYNLVPLMTNRAMFTSAFEQIGGLYALAVTTFRQEIRDNYYLQKLFNIRFVINNHFVEKMRLSLYNSELIYEDNYWELFKIKGDFGEIDSLPLCFGIFVGKEIEWAELMKTWLSIIAKGENPPWIINLSHSGISTSDLLKISPYIHYGIVGKKGVLPDIFSNRKVISLEDIQKQNNDLIGITKPINAQIIDHCNAPKIIYEQTQKDRKKEIFKVKTDKFTPVIFKRAFYRGWDVYIDGANANIYRISPGMQLIFVPEGEHIIEFYYKGPNNFNLAMFSFYGGFFIAMILLGLRIRHRYLLISLSIV